jgi:hypothetical protein
MKDRSTAISTIGAVMLTLVFHSSASAQTKAQSPAQALVNLYQAAQQIIKDPDGDFEDGKNPDFPYPSQMQAQWDASMVAYGNNLSTQERALFPACAAHLNAAITDMEIGCRIKAKQPSEAAQQDGQKRMDEAPARWHNAQPRLNLPKAKSAVPQVSRSKAVWIRAAPMKARQPAAHRVSNSKVVWIQVAAMEAPSPAAPPKLPFPVQSIGLRLLTHSKLISPMSGKEPSMTPGTAVGLPTTEGTPLP